MSEGQINLLMQSKKATAGLERNGERVIYDEKDIKKNRER